MILDADGHDRTARQWAISMEVVVKLVTFQTPDGRIAIGCVDVERCAVLDLQYMHTMWLGEPCPALDSMLSLMRAGPAGVDLVRMLLGKSNSSAVRYLPLDQIRLLAPVPVPEQIRDFAGPGGTKALLAGIFGVAAPTSSAIPINSVEVCYSQPIYYISNRFNVIGADADVAWPDYCDYLDFELEFGVFIGATGKDVAPDKANDFIFGYSLFNDFSARDQQMLEMPGLMGPTKGNSFDTGNAIGPWIVTPDEVPDPTALAACVRVNGEVWAATTTDKCLYSFADMITFVSRSETLHPGEFLGSGAIGDCCGLELNRWIKPGDLIEIEIENLGVLRNRVVRTAA